MGTLFVCATPIGNLSDTSLRLLATLAAADLIVAEDTRQIQKLLNKFSIKTPTTSYHKFNVNKKTGYVISQLQEGKKIALVSDSGTPTISDPGVELIEAAEQAGIKVVAIPGPCAMVAALSVAGIKFSSFVFGGFLPAKDGERNVRLAGLKEEKRVLVFYEAPHRLEKTLAAMFAIFGDRRISLVREITKKFEEILSGNLSAVLARIKARPVKGELVLVLEGNLAAGMGSERKEFSSEEIIVELLREGIAKKTIAKLAAKLFGVNRREVYNRITKC